MNSLDHVKMAAIHELQDAVKIRHINMELLNYLTSSLRWILRYCQKNNIEIPEKDKIVDLIDKAIEIDNRTPL
jgi:5-methylcytosine-specific restriction endonuclease McrBC GTP-binding regulatory subunit McrB